MNDKPYRIGIFWGSYNDVFDVPEVLISFKTQEELDAFTRKFRDDNELRAYFDQDIGESALNNRTKIKKNETKNGRFLGRISAYYIDNNNHLNFLKVAYKERKIVRDYHELRKLKERLSFFETVFQELEKKIAKKPINEKMFIVIKTLEKYGYYISDNEKYYLKIYLYSNKDEDKRKLLGFMKNNLKGEIEEEKDISHAEGFEKDKDKYKLYDEADQVFVRIFEKAVRTNDFDELFQRYNHEEIAKKCNYYEIQGKRRRKNYV